MTTTTEEQTLILKTDALGRVRMPADRREAILDAFEKSGMSGQAFADHIGVKYPTFATWVQKRRRARGDYADCDGRKMQGASMAFLEAVVESSTPQEGAMEDCPPDGRTLHVAAASGDGVSLHISVKDSGRGLPAEKLDQVFTPFLTTKPNGLGMGLSICRRIIEGHGGRIWIENNAGAGVTVHITLPIARGELVVA